MPYLDFLKASMEVLPEYQKAALQGLSKIVTDIAGGRIDRDRFDAVRRNLLQHFRDDERKMAVEHMMPDAPDIGETVGYARKAQKLLKSAQPEDLTDLMKRGLAQPPALVTRGREEIPGAYHDFCKALSVFPAGKAQEISPLQPASGLALQT